MGLGGNVDCTYTNHIKRSPTIATTLSADSVDVGRSVHDSATLTGATAMPAAQSPTPSIPTTPAPARSRGTKTVTNGVVPDSNDHLQQRRRLLLAGRLQRRRQQQPRDQHLHGEHLVVNKASRRRTAQNLLPNHSATISGAIGTLAGRSRSSLFSPAQQMRRSAGDTQTVSVNGNGTYSTTNTTFLASATGTWRWLVTYTGDANNQASTSACGVENFTIDNG